MRLPLILLSLLFFACNSGSPEPEAADQDTLPPIGETTVIVGSPFIVWLVDSDSNTKKRNPEFKSEYLNVDTVLRGLNEMYPNIRLDKVGISGDTLFTKIIDSEYLGERMGSSGSEQYLAEAVINLTSVDGIKFVKIDFEEGSHASPGTWSAKDFGDYREIR